MQPPKNYSFKVYKVKLEELEKRENGKFTIIWVTLKYLSQKLTEQREKIIKDRVGLKKKKKAWSTWHVWCIVPQNGKSHSSTSGIFAKGDRPCAGPQSKSLYLKN